MKKRNNGGNMKQTKNESKREKKKTRKYFEEHDIIEIINSVNKQNLAPMTAVNKKSKCKVITQPTALHCFSVLK